MVVESIVNLSSVELINCFITRNYAAPAKPAAKGPPGKGGPPGPVIPAEKPKKVAPVADAEGYYTIPLVLPSPDRARLRVLVPSGVYSILLYPIFLNSWLEGIP